MKVCGINIDFNAEVIREEFTFKQFCDAYRGKFSDELMLPAYEKLTGLKVESKRRKTVRKSTSTPRKSTIQKK